MPRSVGEWIAKTPDDRVPPRVRLRIWQRQLNGGNFAICPLSGGVMRSTAECDLDHEKPLIEYGEHRESNLRYVLKGAHKTKTAGEVALKKHVDAAAKRHAGIKDRGPLAGADAGERAARRDARSGDRRGDKIDFTSRRSLYV